MEKASAKLELIRKYFPDLSKKQSEQFAALDDLYKAWNDKINVISRKDIDGLYEKHILHSLSVAAAFEMKKGSAVLDVGTGGGFPGIPLAIFFPDSYFHLVDSIGKKITVVKEVASAIGLSNLTAQQIRAEEIKNKKFDVIVTRAVAPLKLLWKWSSPLLRKNESWQVTGDAKTSNPQPPTANGLICLKGGDLNQEIAESGCRPMIIGIDQFFPLEFFHEKYILQIPSPGYKHVK
ncbi:MAG TPA: 16S rRNA (guanine(527)-N(7))-methyltransferase RsmG [Puia sp.]|nr:16S rRNA (guanine(527)-N(7))-methyltransferase RsmG [Puia sp.]